MNNVLELTSIEVKSKKLERISGRLASKVRFTPATFKSMVGKTLDQISQAIAKYNTTYAELRNAIVSAEVAAAEQEVRDSAVNDPKAKKEIELRDAQIKEDNLVASITSVEVTKPRLGKLNLDVQKLTGKFGKLKDNFGVNVKKGFLPKALSVPKVYSKTYTAILEKSDLYKLADKVGAIDPTVAASAPVAETSASAPTNAEVKQEVKTANWRGLFDSDENVMTKDVVVAMDSHENPDEEELEFIPVESRGVSSEELSHRKMIGQLGDELQEVRRIKNSSNGVASPFTAGLNEREDSLLSMLSSLSGVEEIAKGRVVEENKVDNTEFQDLIEHIVGYKEADSEEEHLRKEQSLQDYYSDPDVSKTIDELRHKDVLYAFNQPEAYEKVMAAERKDNDRIAAMSTAIDVLDSEEDVLEEANDTILSLDALKQAEIIKQQNDENEEILRGAKEQAQLIEQEIEHQEIVEGAKEQAQLIEQAAEQQEIVEGAKEQAQLLEQAAEQQEIVEGAKEQAQLLEEASEQQEIVEGAKEQAQLLEQAAEQQEIIEGAKEQAQLIEQAVEFQNILEGAKEQARLIQQQIDYEEIKVGAEEQAKMLKTLYDFMDRQDALEKMQQAAHDELVNGAKEQARQLVQQNEMAEIIDSAVEEARYLQAGNEYVEIIDSAKEEAQNLLNKNDQADIINGSEEQAKMLNDISPEAEVMEQLVAQIVYNNAPEEDFKEESLEQAQMLLENNEKADLINGSEEQAKLLLANNQRADLINGSIEQAKLLQAYNDRIDLIRLSIEQAKLLQAYNERADVINGAVEQAKILFEKNKKTTSNSIVDKLHIEIVDRNDRYGSFVSPSKPIKLKPVHMANMNSKIRGLTDNLTNRKATLSSLKEQLNSDNLDFLRYNEDVLKGAEAA